MYFVNSSVKGLNLKKKLLDVSAIQTSPFSSIDKQFAVFRSFGNQTPLCISLK